MSAPLLLLQILVATQLLVRFVLIFGGLDNNRLSAAWANDLACFHPGVIATAAPAVELGRSVVFVLCNGVLGLAGKSARTANALEKEALALKPRATSWI